MSLLLLLSTSIAMSSGKDVRLARVVSIEELGGSIFLHLGVVVPKVGCSFGNGSVLSILKRFFQLVMYRVGVLD